MLPKSLVDRKKLNLHVDHGVPREHNENFRILKIGYATIYLR